MPWTLYRYILWDLLKLLAVTTVVLVTVISFAAAIKPMSDGLLSAVSLLKFVGYTSPTMLAFALPFAGAFASTIVFLRLSSDNEITAMSASGLSYAAILTPVFVLGLVLTLGLFYLSNWVIPGFYRAAAQTVEADLMSVLVTRLDHNQPFEMEDVVLYADTAAQRPLSPAEAARYDTPVPPSQLIELTGVAVGQLDVNNRMQRPVTAERATVVLFRGPGQSSVLIGLDNVMYYDGTQFLRERERTLGPIELPSPLRDQPEFLSWERLRQLRATPERYGDIGELKQTLADAVAAERLRMRLAQALTGSDHAVELTGLLDDQSYRIRAPRLEHRDGTLLLLGGAKPVTVIARVGGEPARRFEAPRALVRVQRGPGAAQPTLQIELRRVRVFHAGATEPATERESLLLPRMAWPTPVLGAPVDDLNAFEMLKLAGQARYRDAPAVGEAGNKLWEAIQRLGYRIKGQLHQRAASAVACLLLLTLGAVLSMKLKGQMPLAVYFWSFALAIVTIVIIHTGTNLAGSTDVPLAAGLSILWMGNIILAIVIAAAYHRLARN